MKFEKAAREKSRLRLAIEGAAGSGKTMSALKLASGLGGKIALIDTEVGSASLYADKFDFDVLELTAPFTPERFTEAIKVAEKEGYDIVIVDSITPEWQGEGGCLEIQNKLGGKYTDWAKVTPRHNKFIASILGSKIHVIVTCRTKAVYNYDENSKKVTKQGTAPIQREGLDFELTVVFSVNENHMATATKDRTSLFDGKDHVISDVTGRTLKTWMELGRTTEPEPPTPPCDEENRAVANLKQLAEHDRDLAKSIWNSDKTWQDKADEAMVCLLDIESAKPE